MLLQRPPKRPNERRKLTFRLDEKPGDPQNAHIFVQVRLGAQGRENLEEFSSRIREFPEVLECYVMMGAIDFLLRIVASDIDAYEKFFFEKLSRVPGIQEINSMVALSEIKATNALPL